MRQLLPLPTATHASAESDSANRVVMSLCGTCQQTPPATLFWIRQGYRAQWRDLTFSVETDSNQWTLRARESGSGAALYTAHRSSAQAARLAAAEFAAFRGFGGAANPELTWQPYW
jgi:hypothetical protein